MNRCISITKNNTRCRAKTKNNKLFCCDDHLPINKEIIEDGCFMCMEKIEKSNELLFFKCKHAFHKSCYLEWLKFSTYDNPICVICRNNVYNTPSIKIKEHIIKLVSDSDMKPIKNILDILDIHSNFPKISTTPDYPPPGYEQI